MPSFRRPPFRAAAALVSAAAVPALGGCGLLPAGDAPPGGGQDAPAAMETGGLRQGEVPDREPAVDEADLPAAEPPAGAPLEERIAWDALKEVVTFARAADPDAESACVAAEESEELEEGAAALDCTVTYRGQEYEYHYAHRSDGSVLPAVSTAPFLREVAEDDLRFDEGTEYVRCDMEETVAMASHSLEDVAYDCTYLDPETGAQEDVEMSVARDGTTAFSGFTR
ncbi:hypothetical protein [Nocardiopsis potens]|uniref:hypothetical protein n=1 Tax=Nocardiopsis potens TaxID=1246458 RepID=UPI00034CAFA4|nr:hypothetical protein [Nocardiopsis potens]